MRCVKLEVEKKCIQFTCERRKRNICCHSCDGYENCNIKCLNVPDKCGKSVNVDGEHKGKFTEDEISFVKENYRKMRNVDIADALGRPTQTIHDIVWRLGLSARRGKKVD